jgi:transcriptional regulator with XRE-family HTH domain
MASSERGAKTATDVSQLRKDAGKWLKEQRRTAGLSQMHLATIIGLKYYTFISQVESGFGRVPSGSMRKWAHALGIPPALFARTLLAYYDPDLHRLLFEEEPS